MDIIQKIKLRLKKLADTKYQKFTASLIPNANNILGVRLPELRKLSKEIAKSQELSNYIYATNLEFHEEVLLQGMLIGLSTKKTEEMLSCIKTFIPKITNWAICDCFCTGLKFTKQNEHIVWNFLQPYFSSKKEYDIRFAYVMLLTYFVEEEYLEKIFDLIDKFNDKRYYARMSVAWLISVCYAKYPELTKNYLKKSMLDNWTYNKSIQKICESYRVCREDKEFLKKTKK